MDLGLVGRGAVAAIDLRGRCLIAGLLRTAVGTRVNLFCRNYARARGALDPKICNIGLDANAINALDRDGTARDKLTNRFRAQRAHRLARLGPTLGLARERTTRV